MIAEKIYGKLADISPSMPNIKVEYVSLDWFEADKKRIRKTTDGNNEIGIAIDEKLSDGDVIYIDNKLCVAVKLTSCPLLQIKVNSMKQMGRLCFEIGNRHLSLKISDDEVLIPLDKPTKNHLENLGFECHEIIGQFDDFIVCKAHGHSHEHHHEHSHEH